MGGYELNLMKYRDTLTHLKCKILMSNFPFKLNFHDSSEKKSLTEIHHDENLIKYFIAKCDLPLCCASDGKLNSE